MRKWLKVDLVLIEGKTIFKKYKKMTVEGKCANCGKKCGNKFYSWEKSIQIVTDVLNAEAYKEFLSNEGELVPDDVVFSDQNPIMEALEVLSAKDFCRKECQIQLLEKVIFSLEGIYLFPDEDELNIRCSSCGKAVDRYSPHVVFALMELLKTDSGNEEFKYELQPLKREVVAIVHTHKCENLFSDALAKDRCKKVTPIQAKNILLIALEKMQYDIAIKAIEEGGNLKRFSIPLCEAFFDCLLQKVFWEGCPVSNKENALELLQFLVKKGFSIDCSRYTDTQSPLQYAAYISWPEGLLFLLQNGADINSLAISEGLETVADSCEDGFDYLCVRAWSFKEIECLKRAQNTLSAHLKTMEIIDSYGGKFRVYGDTGGDAIAKYCQRTKEWLIEIEEKLLR
ncbi:MAG: hypothetical protein QNL04_13885 [SAR324 cluster bacterium]|nr:hypothetical protein [SAR324 cluster bacterium]